jgi:two-component system, chemotaxis family, chemotaxis protein CheY
VARVLVIDDQPHVRATIVAGLKSLGFEVVAAESGRLGLNALENSSFDLAMVDIYMPEMDGVQIIKALRECAPNLPIIAMSGMMFRTSGRSVLNVLPMAPGLTGIRCLQKPFRHKELQQAVQDAIGATV